MLKEFIRVSPKKLFLAIILTALSFFYKRPNYCFDANCYPRGFPFPFVDQMVSGFAVAHKKYILFFSLDFVIWFFVAGLAMYFYNKPRKSI